MTLSQPYAYWVRNDSYDNTVPADEPGLLNRCQATRSVQDLLVRTYMTTWVTVSMSTTTPAPTLWAKGISWIAVAGWKAVATTDVPDPQSGDPGIVATAPLILDGFYNTSSSGVNFAVWKQTERVSAKVFRAAPPDNSDYPCVQSGISLFDPDNIIDGVHSYSFTINIHQYLETLWNSSQPS